LMCGYLCVGAINEGASFLRALTSSKAAEPTREAALVLFGVYAVSQQQMVSINFEFELLLPDDEEPLAERAQAFSEWCSGFSQGVSAAGLDPDQLQDEESQEALQHLDEFAQLDYSGLQIDEEDERALVEVSEYARMAVLRIHADILSSHLNNGQSETAH